MLEFDHSRGVRRFALTRSSCSLELGDFLQYAALALTSYRSMIRFGNQIRLTRREAEAFKEITTFEPEDVRTVADLHAYVDRCKAHYWGRSYATRFLHWLIDREVLACMRGHPMT